MKTGKDNSSEDEGEEEEGTWVVEIKKEIRANRKDVFDYYTNYLRWPEWTAVGRASLEKEGTDGEKFGKGCVRVFVSAGVVTVYEKVLTFERPSRMTYTVIKGGPPMKNHLGEVLFKSAGDSSTTITWRCRFNAMCGTFYITRAIVNHFFKSSLDSLATHFETELAKKK
eukprot:TRINITY_DN4238_c0_g2_i1.p1 TRINITY_DN4238_c0_g2~~TRINITY_DN4238_c0_g2_i1.p1  ORF type:complete len:177 (-),score=34.24 TRINITY_DN4238_c0_g2_i1:319-825(-)